MAIQLEPGQTTLWVEQDKDARKKYRFELAQLLPPGDTLSSVAWAPVSGITVDGIANGNSDTVVWFTGGTPATWYELVLTWTSSPSGARDQITVRMFIKEDAESAPQLGTALFPNKFSAVAKLRRDRLLLVAQNHLPDFTLEDAYVWEKLSAAEAEVSRTLRVKLQPTTFFPAPPTQEQIDALDGAPWELDEGYDYDPDMYAGDRWGFFKTHSSPLISVEKVSFAYPANGGPSFDIPPEWLQLDRKYGHVRIVPLSTSAAAVLTPFVMQLISVGRVIPNMVKITYVAGLQNAAADYPELVDVVKKLAVLKIIEDAFLPQSGSISADGLSQSLSMDMGKYEDTVDRILNGPPGTNGGLRTAIHGITMGVM